MLLHLLSSRRFWPLLVGQTAGILHDNIYKNAFVFLVLYFFPHTHTTQASLPVDYFSNQLAGHWYIHLASALLVLPFFFFSSLAGDLCDKHSKSKMIIIAKTAEVAIAGLGIYGLYYQSTTLMLSCIFLLGLRATFLGALRLAIIPEYLQEKELLLGNAVFETSIFSAILVGDVLANILFISEEYTLGIWALIATLTITTIVSFSSSLFLETTTAKNPTHTVDFNLFRSSMRIVQQTRSRRIVYLCILGISWFWLVSSMVLLEIPVLLKETINTTPGVITFSLVVFSIGITTGSILCNQLLKSRIEATYVPIAAFGIAFLLYDLASILHTLKPHEHALSIWQFVAYWSHCRLLVDFFLIGTLGGLYHVPLYTIMQHESPETQRARIMACHNIISTAFIIVGAFLNFILSTFYNGNPAYTLAFISLMFAWLSLYISQIMPYDMLTTSLRWAFQFFYQARIQGLEHFNKATKDKLIIICNHTSWLDALILAAFLPEKLTFAFNPNMTAHWLIRHFIQLNKVFMIDPTQPMSIRGLLDAVKNGEKVVIFPEGRITETGSLMKLYEFPAMIAESTHAKILPIHIRGMEKTLFSRGKFRSPFPLTSQVHIDIQEARYFPKTSKGDKREKRKIASDFLYKIMTEMNFENTRPQGCLFASMLTSSHTHGRNHTVFNDINRKPMTYQQLIMRCFVFRQVLGPLLHKTPYVGLLLPNALPSIVSFYTLQSMHKTPVMLNYTHGPSQVVNCCQTATVKDILTARKFIALGKLEAHVAQLEQAGFTLHYLEDIAKDITTFQKVTGFCQALFPKAYYSWAQPQRDPNDTAVVLFTSGSEGNPKGVALSHSNIHANIAQILSTYDLNASDTIFNALPLFHSFGMIGGLVAPTIVGMKVFLYPTPLHYRIINELIYDVNATILFSTDYFLQLYASHANAYDFYSLRYVVAGAEKIQESTLKLWSEKFGIRILGGYGVTEASPVVSANNPMHNVTGSVGRFMPKIDYKLEPVADIKEGGQLWIKGPNIMKGYILHDKPGRIQPPKHGWHDTGDICKVDENGFLYILDRAKRFAKIAGEMVSLTAVESLINEVFSKHPNAVIARPSDKRGEEIVLCTEDTAITRQDLQKAFQEKGLSELWIPKHIIVLTIPRFATGKTNYPELKRCLEISP